MDFNKWNKITGWIIFLVASFVYLNTIEATSSLWDCGEYITAAYKLEVGHPPGAPLFMVLGRLFSIFASPENVAVWINALSALSSSFTILFMFWSLTMLLKKLAARKKQNLDQSDQMAILGAAAVGALAYTFSDSFWFSAVEGEVYAMASLFTAIIFWAGLKWDEEMSITPALDRSANRWLLLIFFLLGLAVGVHLLGILVVPAIGYLIYFKTSEKTTITGLIITGLISVFALGFIQEGIIPGTIALASSFEVGFVNSLGLPFFSGTIVFFILLVASCLLAIRFAQSRQKTILYNALMSAVLILIGYGSFAVIVIRSNANTPLDENDPENLVTLHSYLKREQYGSNPILFGQYWNSFRNGEVLVDNRPSITSADEWNDFSAYYLRRFVVTNGDLDLKAYVEKTDAAAFAKQNPGYEVKEKYFESNASIRKNAIQTYAQTTVFPRMYAESPQHIQGYSSWSGYDPNDGKEAELGRDNKRLPTFGENLTYFFRYQVNWMYVRYLMWNFAGRQNDIQGHGDQMRGNWISGYDFIDQSRVGNAEDMPYYTTENPSHNRFFLLPLAFIILGVFFHFYRAPKDAFVLMLAFLFTGLAIVVYLNQKPMEPRERDYAYSGSFYFMAMWIAFGVYALYDFYQSIKKTDVVKMGWFAGSGLAFMALLDLSGDSGMPNVLSWLTIWGTLSLLIGALILLKKVSDSNKIAAGLATALGLIVPVLMGVQGWDDHDRSGKTTARDLAYNYLNSCKKNGIIFTNGDNDTFPLWYLQEVEGKRTDVRVCNLSLMGTDWYTNQMKLKAYESEALPIKFKEEQILMYAGNTDQIQFLSLMDMVSYADAKLLKKIIGMRVKNKKDIAQQAILYFNANLETYKSQVVGADIASQQTLNTIWAAMGSTDLTSIEENIYKKYDGFLQIISAAQNKLITFQGESATNFQKLIEEFEKPWESVDLEDAMAFTRDENNYLSNKDGSHVSFFPSRSFSFKVNKAKALASGVISKKDLARCADVITFSFNANEGSLSRDEIMMMDIVANNQWERPIYFSSNRGSTFSYALLASGWIKQVGMAYVLNPVKVSPQEAEDGLFDVDEMYKNLVNVYQYGDMANPAVITDYYARRHVSQYRINFLLLAEQFHKKQDNAKGIKLLDMSLKTIPAERVLDFTEVSSVDPMNGLTVNRSHYMYENGENPIRAKSSGCLNEYVQLYFLMGAPQKAEALGRTLLDQYESILRFYENTDVHISASIENTEDLFAVCDALFKIYGTITTKNTQLNSAFGKRLKNDIDRIYKTILPKMTSQLMKKASDRGEDIQDFNLKYGRMLGSLTQNLQIIGEHYGYLKTEARDIPAEPTPSPNLIINR